MTGVLCAGVLQLDSKYFDIGNWIEVINHYIYHLEGVCHGHQEIILGCMSILCYLGNLMGMQCVLISERIFCSHEIAE